MKTAARHTSFREEIYGRCAGLFLLCQYAREQEKAPEFPSRDFLRRLYSESARIEEFLDACGARRNSEWFQFREYVASQKLLSYVGYNVRHIASAARDYTLLIIKSDFEGDTCNSMTGIREAILLLGKELLKTADLFGFSYPDSIPVFDGEGSLSGKLDSDKKLKSVEDPSRTAIYLATKVLNYSEDCEVLDILKERKSKEHAASIPFIVSEGNIRIVETRFHNLQAMYDTYILETDLETTDQDLPVLRSHISMIYHLLESATCLSHFYERHILNLYQGTGFPFKSSLLLDLLYDYFLHYARLYLEVTKKLCRSIIHSYAETSEITVPIPRYRGFHVRPSALIARIAAHYGSPLVMILDDNEYDASQPLELFRANEEINAQKRRLLGDLAEKMKKFNHTLNHSMSAGNTGKILTRMLFDLARKKAIILYDHSIDCSEISYEEYDTFGHALMAISKHYLATGVLDINSDIMVTFRGDNRAISDLQVLSRSGYGEDIFGNNTMLPPELRYLR
ncbi:MAG: hypothetical protein JW874_07240 [Spirochaetales bacterium]|nr:hypothetical protein [Spirochaetales bacterium]